MKRDASDLGIAAQNGIVLAPVGDTSLEEQDWDQIKRFLTPAAIKKFGPKDVYAFRTIPSGDGLDFYFTRQDPETSLTNFVRNLHAGQSLLGSHNINTFSYGTSYDAVMESADRSADYYEQTFYSKYAHPELATDKIVMSKSYMVRGMKVNGENTDDLIRGMELGAIRKISVSFSVGQYACGIDGRDMLAGWGDNPSPIVPESGCRHFPGVEYKGDGLAWAWMKDGDLLEQSLVYKNASPSAMLVRKAETMAQRGMFSVRDRSAIEERISRANPEFRLPAYERSVFASAGRGGSPQLEEGMSTRHIVEGEGEGEDNLLAPSAATDPPIYSQHTPEPVIETVETVEPVPEPVAETAESVEFVVEPTAPEAVEAEVVDPIATEAPVVAEVESEEPTQIPVAVDAATPVVVEPVPVAAAPATAAASASPEERGLIVAQSRLAAYEARERAMREALSGQTPTPTLLRQMVRDADLGQKMFATRVERAVAERVRAQGEEFNSASADRYREHLLTARTPDGDLDVDFIDEEIATWATQKQARFTSGRSVIPRDLPSPTAAERKRAPERRVDYDPSDNVLSQLDQ